MYESHPELLLDVASLHIGVDVQVLVPTSGESRPLHRNIGLASVGVSGREERIG